MSIRNLVEFNHDHIDKLLDEGHISDDLHKIILGSADSENAHLAALGIKVVAQYDHTKEIKIVTSEDA